MCKPVRFAHYNKAWNLPFDSNCCDKQKLNLM